MLSAILADKVNLGYDGVKHRVVEKVNGKVVHGLRHLHDLLQRGGKAVGLECRACSSVFSWDKMI